MRILVVDYILMHGLPIAQRCALDGHEVIYASCWGPKSDSPYMDVLGYGIKNVRVDPEGWMRWIDKVDVATVTGSEHRGHIPDFLRKNGVPTAGPGSWGVRLELDRSYGRQILVEMGLRPNEQQAFTKVEDLIKYVGKHPDRYIMKLDQTAREFSETVVGRDSEGRDVIEAAKRLQADLSFAEGFVKLYLEPLLEGTEVGVGGFFNGDHFLGTAPHVSYEESSSYAYDFRISSDKLVDKEKIEAVLRKYRFRGSIDINGFLTKDGYRSIEFTPRWGNGTTEFFCHAAPDLGKLLYAVAAGKKADDLRGDIVGRVGVCVDAKVEAKFEGPEPVGLLDPDASTPAVRSDNVSLWPIWPGRTRAGWMSLPVHGTRRELRGGSYVATADSVDRALRAIDLFSKDVFISGTHADIGRAREDLTSKVDKVYRYTMGYEWVDQLAADTDYLYGPLKKQARS